MSNENSERAEVFNQAMKQKSKAVIDSTLQAYPFEKISTIYDIGGGQGHFLAALFKSNPQIKGVLFDLPEVIATLTNSSLKLDSSRCEFITGDFFTAIPTGGDAYVLKSIIHDWNDEQALQILKNCNQAMAETSRLLLIEVVLRPSNEADYARCMDLLMLAVTGGKERSRDSFEKLLDQAGFEIEAVYPTTTEFSVIEAKKRQCLPICPE